MTTETLLTYLPYLLVSLVLSLVCLGIAVGMAASALRWVFVSRRRAREGRTIQWAHGCYSLWTGGEDSGQWPRSRGAQSLKDWYGITEAADFWALAKDLERGAQTGNLAWDAVRGLDLLRIAVAAGLITDEQCWEAVRRTATPLRAKYASWDALAADFEAGMLAWYDRQGNQDATARGRVQRNLPTLKQYMWPAIDWNASI